MSILLGFLTVLLLPPFVVRVIIIFVNFRIRAKKKKQRETKKELRDVNAETVKDTVNITDKNRKKKLKRDEKRKVRLEKRKATIDAILTALRTLKAFLKTILHGIHILYWTLFIFLTTIIMPMYLFTLVMFAVVVILLINAYNKISGENQSSQLAEQQQIADYLDEKCSQIDRIITLKQKKIKKLQQYKKSIIYEYVTGKKEV